VWKLKVNRQIGGCVVFLFQKKIAGEKKRIPAAHSDLRSGDSFLCFFICFLFLFMYHFSFYSIRSNAVFLP